MNNLPAPPALHPKANMFWLPAMLPSNESQRLSSLEPLIVGWNQGNKERALSILDRALSTYGVTCAALSFVNKDFEIVVAHRGLYYSNIERAASIAAHALLSDDVLVVLDTLKVCVARLFFHHHVTRLRWYTS